MTKIKWFIQVNLRGIAQIMLQEKSLTGLILLIGVLYSSWLMAIGLLVANLIGTCIGLFFKKKYRVALNQGLYGFNAALLGIIIVYQYGLTGLSFVAILIASVLATLMMHYAIVKKLEIFTFPFVVFSWIIVSLINAGDIMPRVTHPTAAENFLQEPTAELFEETLELVGIEYDEDEIDEDLIFATHGFGQVMFQGSVIAGVLFFLGVYVSRPVSALYGIFASILAMTVSHLLNRPETDADTGMFSFNAVLCALAFAGTRKRDGFWVVVATIITVIVDDFMISIDVPPYTFPFVATTWILLISRSGISGISKLLASLFRPKRKPPP